MLGGSGFLTMRGAKRGNNQEGLVTAGLYSLRETRWDCHSEPG
jgi:hypothetical protein